MANKNHDLDQRIIDAAKAEFLLNGYEKASLRKIAVGANVTIGAIYTLYKTKDCLFTSLVTPLIEEIKEAFASIKGTYYKDSVPSDTHSLLSSLETESMFILHLLFDNYDKSRLLLCKSVGSSMGHFFNKVVDLKIQETIRFFENVNIPHPSYKIMKLFTSSQFHMYYQVINDGCSLEEAKEMIGSAVIFNTGGWLALLDNATKDKCEEA